MSIRKRQVREIMRRDVTTVAPDTAVGDLARLLTEENISGVPVVDDEDGRVVGVVSAADVVRALASEAESPAWLVGATSQGNADFPAWFTGAEASLATPMLRRVAGGGVDGWTVREIMTPATFTVRPEATITELATFLTRAGIHRALVMEKNRLVGIVSATDVLAELAE